MLYLTMVVSTEYVPQERPAERPEAEEGEDDGIVVDFPAVTPPANTGPQTVEITSPVAVNPGNVRSFYPRKKDRHGRERNGTRITFDNGSGMAVTEPFEIVKQLFEEWSTARRG